MFKFIKFIFCLPVSVFLLLFCRKLRTMKYLVLKIIFLLIIFPAFSQKIKEDKEAFQEAFQKFKSFAQSDLYLNSSNPEGLFITKLKTLFFDPGYMSEKMFFIIFKKVTIDSAKKNFSVYNLKDFIDLYENSDELTKLDARRVLLIHIILKSEAERRADLFKLDLGRRFNKIQRKLSLLPAIVIYLEDLELFQTALDYNLFDGNQRYKKKLLELAFQWKKDKTVKWFIEKDPQLIANEKRKFFNLMLQQSNLEGMKWIAGLVEVELMPEYLEKAVKGKKWEIADWLVKKKPQLLSQLNFEELFDIMLNQKNMEGIKWITELTEIEVRPDHVRTAMINQSWEIADWLIIENSHLLEQINFTELFGTILNQKNMEGIKWITELTEIEVRPDHVRTAMINQSWEIADWLIMENLHLLEQINFTELFDTMLNQKNMEGIKWIAGRTKTGIMPGHLRKAIANRIWEIADWLVKKNPQIISQMDFTELFNEMLSQNHLEGVKWITGLEFAELEIIPEHLRKATVSQSWEIADWLVKRDSQMIHQIDQTEIFETAMESEHIETAEWLFKNGFVLSEEHFDKASSKGKEKFAEWLLDHIDHRQNTQNQKGQMDREQEIPSNEETSLAKLIQAIENRDIQKAKQLSKDVDLNEVHQGHTVLTKSIETQEHRLIRFFMNDRSINIDTQAGGGLTASMWAVIKGDLKTLEELGKKGADFHIRDNKNRMLPDIAEEFENPAVKRKLFQTIKKFLCKNSVSSSH